jgi:hypothetical protein
MNILNPIKMNSSLQALLVAAMSVAAGTSYPQYRHSLDFCPLSPAINIYALHYCYQMTGHDELIVSPLYKKIPYKNIGHTDAWGFIAGYRRYFWRNLHADYQLMPAWDNFYEENEEKRYKGFDLWNEFRFGYSFDFTIGKVPLFVNVQWPFGFALYSEGKPESFKNLARENPLFYFPPLFFTGVRF